MGVTKGDPRSSVYSLYGTVPQDIDITNVVMLISVSSLIITCIATVVVLLALFCLYCLFTVLSCQDRPTRQRMACLWDVTPCKR